MQKRPKRCCVCRKGNDWICEPCKAMRRLLNALHRRTPVRLDDATMAERVEQYRNRVARGELLFEQKPQRVA